jgi:hypothetical protein
MVSVAGAGALGDGVGVGDDDGDGDGDAVGLGGVIGPGVDWSLGWRTVPTSTALWQAGSRRLEPEI